MKRSHLVGFVKSQERSKSLGLLNSKIRGLGEDLARRGVRVTVVKGGHV